MARYPLHPRLSRLMVEARRRGVAEQGCDGGGAAERRRAAARAVRAATRSDLLVLMESPWDCRARADGAAGAAAWSIRRGSKGVTKTRS
jgi:ATP-dependent helicase HrpB